MRRLRRSVVGLALTGLGSSLLGPLTGCSSAGSATPQHDPVEGRKVKDDLLKKVSKPGKTRSGKAGATDLDRF